MPAARATKAEIQRSIAAAEAMGKVVRGHEIRKEGTIRVLYVVDIEPESDKRKKLKKFRG